MHILSKGFAACYYSTVSSLLCFLIGCIFLFAYHVILFIFFFQEYNIEKGYQLEDAITKRHLRPSFPPEVPKNWTELIKVSKHTHMRMQARKHHHEASAHTPSRGVSCSRGPQRTGPFFLLRACRQRGSYAHKYAHVQTYAYAHTYRTRRFVLLFIVTFNTHTTHKQTHTLRGWKMHANLCLVLLAAQ